MFELTTHETTELHQEALRRSAHHSQALRRAGFGSAPLELRLRSAVGNLLIDSGQRIKQAPAPQAEPCASLLILL